MITDAAILREALQADLKLLEFMGCQFFACNGPDHPSVSMETCKVCWRIRELRALLDARPVNPYLPEAPSDGKHIFINNSYRCCRCGVYNRPQPENPAFYEACEGAWAQSGKLRYAAENRWAAELADSAPE